LHSETPDATTASKGAPNVALKLEKALKLLTGGIFLNNVDVGGRTAQN